jgi:hypothetical protein
MLKGELKGEKGGDQLKKKREREVRRIREV